MVPPYLHLHPRVTHAGDFAPAFYTRGASIWCHGLLRINSAGVVGGLKRTSRCRVHNVAYSWAACAHVWLHSYSEDFLELKGTSAMAKATIHT